LYTSVVIQTRHIWVDNNHNSLTDCFCIPIYAWNQAICFVMQDLFTVFMRGFAWLIRLGLPPKAWDITVEEQGERSFPFTVLRCFYLDLFTAYSVAAHTTTTASVVIPLLEL
jgi:hypothetical protein